MRVKASTIIRACNDVEVEKRFAYRYRKAGYPPIQVIWDIPKTKENLKLVSLKLVSEFVYDYYEGAKILRAYLCNQKEKEAKEVG